MRRYVHLQLCSIALCCDTTDRLKGIDGLCEVGLWFKGHANTDGKSSSDTESRWVDKGLTSSVNCL